MRRACSVASGRVAASASDVVGPLDAKRPAVSFSGANEARTSPASAATSGRSAAGTNCCASVTWGRWPASKRKPSGGPASRALSRVATSRAAGGSSRATSTASSRPGIEEGYNACARTADRPPRAAQLAAPLVRACGLEDERRAASRASCFNCRCRRRGTTPALERRAASTNLDDVEEALKRGTTPALERQAASGAPAGAAAPSLPRPAPPATRRPRRRGPPRPGTCAGAADRPDTPPPGGSRRGSGCGGP